MHNKGKANNSNDIGLIRMEALVRISNIPLIESGVKTAEQVYFGLKNRNGLLNWSFVTAENVLFSAVDTVRPAVKIIEGPLQRIDQILCSSLDAVEQRVPSVYLPPQLILYNTKEYMSNTLVRPVLKRAGSVKQIGNAVLDSRVSTYAVDRIEGALDVADKYIDKYLPPNAQDQTDSSQNANENDNESKAMHTFHKGQRFSRKLKRRLTLRTVAEARALKKQSKEAIHVLIYAAELILTDPILALQKAKELWSYLSTDEPENQARPQTIEELIILITRESARRVVHFTNFLIASVGTVPNVARDLLHQFLYATDSLLKVAHLDDAKSAVVNETYIAVSRLSMLYNTLSLYTSSVLERVAYILAGRIEAERNQARKNASKYRNTTIHSRTNNNPIKNNVNGGL